MYHRSRTTFIFIIFGILVLVALGTVWYFRGNLKQAAVEQAAERLVADPGQRLNLTELLGFNEPRTYLVLLLNNTELRPGGGFIGAYALVKFDHATPQILTLAGTENLLPNATLPSPPAPLAKYLKTNAWHFRDSNWSPDFASSSRVGLDLYAQEGGAAAADISGVIGFTPTVIESLLKLVGPITVGDQTYTADNFTEKLEYEVEYGYSQRGVLFKDRKAALGELAHALLGRLKISVLTHWSDYLRLAQQLLDQKQIMVYAKDDILQRLIRERGWSGEMKASPEDYLLWVDANLGSLKTDRVIKRTLSYTIASSTKGYLATATMRYQHQGKTDWRTSVYRNYARVFVPLGSTMVGALGGRLEPGALGQGVENGRRWFGMYTSLAPGQTKELSFQYLLPPSITNAIKQGDYQLFIQKELGTLSPGLTLNLNFATTVTWANPGEPAEEHGDSRYVLKTDLLVDREFRVLLQH